MTIAIITITLAALLATVVAVHTHERASMDRARRKVRVFRDHERRR